MATLYLLETRAAENCTCAACHRVIRRGTAHFRHDPVAQARYFRGEKYSHWCYQCIMATNPGPKDKITGRLWVARSVVVEVSKGRTGDMLRLDPVRIALIGIGPALSEQLISNTALIHSLSPEQFEEFVCDRLVAMGQEPKRVGATNRKDGGIDIVFWPRVKGAFPFLGVAQVKHHRNPRDKERSSTVREFAGAIAGRPINAGLIVTNTSFSPDAEWYARERASLIRLRGFADIQRWLADNFTDEAEWREIPQTLELCPGVVVRIR
jgi:hypothetical protein